MLFQSQIFVFVFLPLCLTGLVLFRRWALWWLIGLSFLFYGWWNPAHVPLLAASILANYAVGRRIARGPHARAWLIGGVAADLALLGWFKYAGFLFGVASTEAPPLAISFFTFQQIMFLTDCWGGRVGLPLPLREGESPKCRPFSTTPPSSPSSPISSPARWSAPATSCRNWPISNPISPPA
jgi:D-alanyl-lipoteichoic acid acyltransferase DltB (MBOAT superfamily)